MKRTSTSEQIQINSMPVITPKSCWSEDVILNLCKITLKEKTEVKS